MRRRALLQGVLGLQIVAGLNDAAGADSGVLLSGLAGMDYSVGGAAASELICVTSPPWSGKTVLLLNCAPRICDRYFKNVVFYSAIIARNGVAKGRAPIFFARDTEDQIPYTREIGSSGTILMLDAQSAHLAQAQDLAAWLRLDHSAGCAALVSDGWCSQRTLRSALAFGSESWAPTPMSMNALCEAREIARVSRLPVLVGVQTASLVDDEVSGESFQLNSLLRSMAARWASLRRPELFVDTEDAIVADKNVVSLSVASQPWGPYGMHDCGSIVENGACRLWCDLFSSCAVACWSSKSFCEMV